METRINIKTTPNIISSFFTNGINKHADIRYYEFISDSCCKVIIRHSDKITLKENATYSLKGFLRRCQINK